MIQASELRIGNWIKHADNGVWVPEYVGKPLMVSIDELITIDNDEKQDYYEPIELTPEILEAAGFHEIYNGEWKIRLNNVLSIFIVPNVSDAYLWYDANDLKMCIADAPMKYLHQVQNVWFSITGQELPITIK